MLRARQNFWNYLPHSGFQSEWSGALLAAVSEVLQTILIGSLSEASSSEIFCSSKNPPWFVRWHLLDCLLLSIILYYANLLLCVSYVYWEHRGKLSCKMKERNTKFKVKKWHFQQLNCFLPVWIPSCLLKLLSELNFVSHLGQLNGFSSTWILSCLFKLLNVEHLKSQCEQLNGLSPVWVLPCLFRLLLSEHL